MRSSLPDELLMYADKLSMAHGLELRVPYLDHKIVEYVECLPARYKVNRFNRKWLHKEICKKLLPSELIKRKKRGFAVNVVDEWFSEIIDNEMDETFLNEKSYIYNYFKPAKVRKLLKEHKAKRHDNHKILFSLIVFDKWLQINN